MLILKLSFLWVLLILYRRQNLNPISNIREAAPRSSFWDPNGLNKFLEVCFAFPFSLIGKSTMAFSTGQSWCVQCQILVHRWGPENKDFSALLQQQTLLIRVQFSSLAQARLCCVLEKHKAQGRKVGSTSSVKQKLYEVRSRA